jgi:hypothetical protein
MRWLILLMLGCHHDGQPDPISNRAPPSPPVDAGPPPSICDAYVHAYEHAMACRRLPLAARATIDQSHTDWIGSVAEAGLDNPGYDPEGAYEHAQQELKCQDLASEVQQLSTGVCP